MKKILISYASKEKMGEHYESFGSDYNIRYEEYGVVLTKKKVKTFIPYLNIRTIHENLEEDKDIDLSDINEEEL